MTCNAVNFGYELRNFNLYIHAVFIAVDTVGCLYCKFADTVHDVGCFLQISFTYLNETDTVLRVARSLVQTADLRTHFFGHGQTGSIVTGTVDFHTGRQFFHVFSLSQIRYTQDAARVHC